MELARLKSNLDGSSSNCICEADYSCSSALPSFVTTDFLTSFADVLFCMLWCVGVFFFSFMTIHVSFRGAKYLIKKGRRLMRLSMTVRVSLVLRQVLSKNTTTFSHNKQYKLL